MELVIWGTMGIIIFIQIVYIILKRDEIKDLEFEIKNFSVEEQFLESVLDEAKKEIIKLEKDLEKIRIINNLNWNSNRYNKERKEFYKTKYKECKKQSNKK